MSDDDGWHFYGMIWDKQALIQTITVLQKQGHKVRCVKDGNRTKVYTDQPPPKVGP